MEISIHFLNFSFHSLIVILAISDFVSNFPCIIDACINICSVRLKKESMTEIAIHFFLFVIN